MELTFRGGLLISDLERLFVYANSRYDTPILADLWKRYNELTSSYDGEATDKHLRILHNLLCKELDRIQET